MAIGHAYRALIYIYNIVRQDLVGICPVAIVFYQRERLENETNLLDISWNKWFLTRYAMNTGWWEFDIYGCYSLLKIASTPIYACKNNRQKLRHNASTTRSRDVTDQLWWRHNARSEKTVPSDNSEMICRRSIFLNRITWSGHKITCKT